MQDEIKRESEEAELSLPSPKKTVKRKPKQNKNEVELQIDDTPAKNDEEFAEMPSFFSLPGEFFAIDTETAADSSMEPASTDDNDVAELVNAALIAVGKEPLTEEAEPEVTDTVTADASVKETEEKNESDPVAEEKIDERFINVEHFSDSYKTRFLSDDEPESEPIIEEEIELIDEEPTDEANIEPADTEIEMSDIPTEDEEYENLTIFEEDSIHPANQKSSKNANPDEERYDPKKPRKVDGRFDLIELFVFTLVAIMLITTFFFKHSIVDGPSMESTLYNGDHLIISDFLYEPEQYDIVVVHDKEAYPDPVVKRVIATEGQTVTLIKRLIPEVSSDDMQYFSLEVYVDGVAIEDEYAYYSNAGHDPISINISDGLHEVVDRNFTYPNMFITYEYVVPEDEIYVLGDHRNRSQDSREFGSVKKEAILGKVLFRIYPFAEFGAVE